MGPGVLEQVLCNLPHFSDPRLLVGFDNSDDACVYQVSEELAVLQTVDFFPPLVDDPYLFGQIAAANALSDIYAMGAVPTLAMNLLCYPSSLPLEMVQQILAGGADKVKEAGAIVAGGHTIEDAEPKYGLCVTGFAHPKKVLANSTARAGDVLVLTKPLGTGILTTATKAGQTTPEELSGAVQVMTALNRAARDAMVEVGANACTDVTGFGLLGHAFEMAKGSGVSILLDSKAVPTLPGALKYALAGLVPGGAGRNRDYLKDQVSIAQSVPKELCDLLFDPQTSGGLLIALEESRGPALLQGLSERSVCAQMVGRVLPAGEKRVIVQ